MGPMANARRIDAMESFVADAKQRGGKVVTGGKRHGNQGYLLRADGGHRRARRFQGHDRRSRSGRSRRSSRSRPSTRWSSARTRWNSGSRPTPSPPRTRPRRRSATRSSPAWSASTRIAISTPETPFGGVKESGHGSEGGIEGLERLSQYQVHLAGVTRSQQPRCAGSTRASIALTETMGCRVKPGDDTRYACSALWHACQSFSGVAGMSRCAPAPPGMASAMAFITAAIAAVVPASPAPLTPSGLVVAGTGVDRVLERRHVVGARHGVVHERAGDELPAASVVDRVLHHRLAEALRDRAVGLALDDHRVERVAAIVDRRVGDERRARRSRDRSRPRRCGSRWERSAASPRSPWCRGLRGFRRASSSPWRARRDRTARCCGRCRPRRSGRCGIRCRLPPVSSTLAAIVLPLASMRLDGLDQGMAHGHRRARADRGVARDLHARNRRAGARSAPA